MVDMSMLRLRITFTHAAELRRAIEEEMRRGVLLMKITPPAALEFRAPLSVALTSPGGALTVASEVLSILPGVGVGVLFPAERVPDARAILAATPAEPQGDTVHEILPEQPPQSIPPPSVNTGRATFADKVQ